MHRRRSDQPLAGVPHQRLLRTLRGGSHAVGQRRKALPRLGVRLRGFHFPIHRGVSCELAVFTARCASSLGPCQVHADLKAKRWKVASMAVVLQTWYLLVPLCVTKRDAAGVAFTKAKRCSPPRCWSISECAFCVRALQLRLTSVYLPPKEYAHAAAYIQAFPWVLKVRSRLPARWRRLP